MFEKYMKHIVTFLFVRIKTMITVIEECLLFHLKYVMNLYIYVYVHIHTHNMIKSLTMPCVFTTNYRCLHTYDQS